MKDPEFDFFRDIFRARNEDLAISHTPGLAALEAKTRAVAGPTRLIAFSTQVIVPAEILARLDYNAYNFHPGPPEYPGSRQSVFAVYDGVGEFGVTLHRMIDSVDSGAIVASDRFAIGRDAFAKDVATEAYRRMAALAIRMSTALADPETPLIPSGESWLGPKRTLSEYEELRRISADMPLDELERRFRACDGIYSPLSSADASAAPSRSDS